ncbi:monovalent cation/H+ antiporter subunit D [Xylophilus sp. GOD-11R]|uniref:monovalent cation/H+ antiporter subunit D n=1 Tax=Xylophilus sp. GOD-11R TaxID=3089814 RepID=UPI00298C1F64|nr:monovalent cation/H+ antiporter subunit D [Xylophilus sp. GOD-11R]WPB57879.1 monovalent cation/H+ antiporter subunit D [Xylophilus sp. GOD-11R]
MNPLAWFPLTPDHLVVAPILLPMLAAAVMLLLGPDRYRAQATIGAAATGLGLLVSVMLLLQVDRGGADGVPAVYLAGNWRAPFGIVLAADRLSAVMLVLAHLVALGALVFSTARWQRVGVNFHPLFQLQVMGLAGAFLTGDLFNLFVFFEILLAASYGLLLHGSGGARVQSGMHYVALNLAASSLFLIGAALVYGSTGTLNMADLARRMPHLLPGDAALARTGAALLAVTFLTKAAAWPLNFWLVRAYAAATPPAAAIFAVMSKVGLYALLRLGTLCFPGADGNLVLMLMGLATMGFGVVGLIASQRLSYLAGYALLVSSGTVLAAIGLEKVALTAAALYYLSSSTLAASAFLLLTDLIERWRNGGAVFAPHQQAREAPFLGRDLKPLSNLDLDEEQEQPTGRTLPANTALLGLAFMVCALVLAGLPPLSGFTAKIALLTGLFNPLGLGQGVTDVAGVAGQSNTPGVTGWVFAVLLLATGLAGLLGFSRAAMRNFWAARDRGVPRLRLAECTPIAVLLAGCVMLTIFGGPALGYLERTAGALQRPQVYIDAVLGTPAVTAP